ncbi:MAG: hypothetical protein VW455_06455 [Nitrospinota bacterium]
MTSLFPANFDTAYRTEDASGEELSPPSGICQTSEGNFLIADDFNHRIQVYDPQFKLIHCFGEKGKEPGQLQYPKGLAVDKEGNIFVADSWNHRIQKFDPKGNHLQTFGSCGDQKGQLNEPWDIHIDPSGTIIVVERYNHRIQFFDQDGNSLGWVGQRGTTVEENLAYLYETPLNIQAPPLFEFPTSIATDSVGNFFVTDSGNHRIRKFNSQWKEILTFGSQGDQTGEFQYPLCVSIAPNDLLYIADLNNNRIQIYTSFGQFLSSFDQADTAMEAPCLTLMDSSGNLFVGSTFDTKILKFQITQETEIILAEKLATSEPLQPAHVYFYSLVQEKNNNNPKALAALEQTLGLLNENANSDNLEVPNRLGQMAFEGKDVSDSSIDLALPLIEKQFNESRQAMIDQHQSWQALAKKFNEIQIKEHQLVQKDPQGLREFNRELYTSEHEEKESYRETRRCFCTFRKTTQQFYDFIYRLIESNISEKQLENLTELLLRQWEITVDKTNEFFNEKEKSEESMVQILGSSGSDQLPSFLVQYYYNCRTLDLLIQLQFPLRAHCQILNVLARKAAKDEKISESLRRLTTPSLFSENATRTMIRFHEHWFTLDILELMFLETMDITQPYLLDDGEKVIEPGIEDFSPIAFDSENLDIPMASRILLSQSAEIMLENGVLSHGLFKFNLATLSNQRNELMEQCQATLEAQPVFDKKHEELLNQLNDLERQRRDLDAQLRQVGTEDKATPIGISNNIAIMDFQLNLLRRMIRGIDINENLNLHRLVTGTAVVKALNPDEKDNKLFDGIETYFQTLENKIQEILNERRLKNFDLAPLREQQKQLAGSPEISTIETSIKVEEGINETKAYLDRLELEFKKFTKTKSCIQKILSFIDKKPTTPETPLKQVYSVSKIGAEIGLLFYPQGLTHNSQGDLLVVDNEQHQIHCYSPEGKYKFHFGTWGNTAATFKYPVNLATDSQNNIYAIDEGNGVVKKFDAQGNFILTFDEGILGSVFSLSVDAKDQIHIADSENNRIVVFDSNGKEISLPSTAEQSRNLEGPCGIFCLKDGGILVGDRSEYLLKQFDSEGKLVRSIQKNNLGFNDIYFIAYDDQFGIYGSDYWHNQIIHLNSNLELVDVYRNQGSRAGELGKTGGLSIHDGRLAVSNFDGRKVQVFDLTK